MRLRNFFVCAIRHKLLAGEHKAIIQTQPEVGSNGGFCAFGRNRQRHFRSGVCRAAHSWRFQKHEPGYQPVKPKVEVPGIANALYGKTVCIVGLGEIGRLLADRLKPFWRKTAGDRRSPQKGSGRCKSVSKRPNEGSLRRSRLYSTLRTGLR